MTAKLLVIVLFVLAVVHCTVKSKVLLINGLNKTFVA